MVDELKTNELKETSESNIYQRINAVRKEIGYIQKDRAVSTGGGSYKAVSHDAVTALLREHLIEHGIVVRVSVVDHEFDQPVVNADGSHAKQRLFSGTFEVQFVNVDNPDDRTSDMYPAHALDNGDKAPGKAISYATKYALLKTFSIETGEDEESRHQIGDYDFARVLEMAGEADAATASLLIAEARNMAVKLKDTEASKNIAAMSRALKAKFNQGQAK